MKNTRILTYFILGSNVKNNYRYRKTINKYELYVRDELIKIVVVVIIVVVVDAVVVMSLFNLTDYSDTVAKMLQGKLISNKYYNNNNKKIAQINMGTGHRSRHHT